KANEPLAGRRRTPHHLANRLLHWLDFNVHGRKLLILARVVNARKTQRMPSERQKAKGKRRKAKGERQKAKAKGKRQKAKGKRRKAKGEGKRQKAKGERQKANV